MDLDPQLEMKPFLIESFFHISCSVQEEETVPVIISPHQTILASLGKACKDCNPQGWLGRLCL